MLMAARDRISDKMAPCIHEMMNERAQVTCGTFGPRAMSDLSP
jgi:hypothetical protein